MSGLPLILIESAAGPAGLAVGAAATCVALPECRAVVQKTTSRLWNELVRPTEISVSGLENKPPEQPEESDPKFRRKLPGDAGVSILALATLAYLDRTSKRFPEIGTKESPPPKKLIVPVFDPSDPRYREFDLKRRTLATNATNVSFPAISSVDQMGEFHELMSSLTSGLPDEDARLIREHALTYYTNRRNVRFQTGLPVGAISNVTGHSREGNPLILRTSSLLATQLRSSDKPILVVGVPGNGKSVTIRTAIDLLNDPTATPLSLVDEKKKEMKYGPLELLRELVKNATGNQDHPFPSLELIGEIAARRNTPLYVGIDEASYANDDALLSLLSRLSRIPNVRTVFGIHPGISGVEPTLLKELQSFRELRLSPINPDLFALHLTLLFSGPPSPWKVNRQELQFFLDTVGRNPLLAEGLLCVLLTNPVLVLNNSSSNFDFLSVINSTLRHLLREYEYFTASGVLRPGTPDLGLAKISEIFGQVLYYFVPRSAFLLLRTKLTQSQFQPFSATPEELKTLDPLIRGGYLKINSGFVAPCGDFFRLYLRSQFIED